LELIEWKKYANSVLSPTERVKDELRLIIAEYGRKFPSWEQKNDARRSWFTGAKLVLSTSQLGYLYIRDQLTDTTWWRAKTIEHNMIKEQVHEFEIYLRYGFSNMLFTITEETLRSVVKSIDSTACNGGTSNFESIYTYLLKVTKKQQYLDLFNFHRLIRNTIHTNGVFRPTNNRDKSIMFLDKQYNFVCGEKINFQSYELLLNLVSQYKVALVNIFEDDNIISLPHVGRFKW
jgi:hypothetical protein